MINIDWTNCIIGIKNKFTSSGRPAIPMYASSIENSYLIPILATTIANIVKKEVTKLIINPKSIKKLNLTVTLTS